MPLINNEINLILTWASTYVITNSIQGRRFAITETKISVRVVTLSTQDNARLLQQSKFSFKRTINWNKYQSKISSEDQNQYLDLLMNPSF